MQFSIAACKKLKIFMLSAILKVAFFGIDFFLTDNNLMIWHNDFSLTDNNS